MITSKQNDFIKGIRSLSDKKFRDRLNLFVVEGIKLVNEAIELGLSVRSVVYTEKAFPSLRLGDVEGQLVSDDIFKFISEEITPQGALAVVEKPLLTVLPPTGKCLMLDGVADPANVGAIIRTAAAAGYNEVYLTADCADAYSQKAVRASMSGVFRVKVMRGWREDILSKISFPIIASDMDGEDAFKFSPIKDFCLVIGNEGHGISDTVMAKASHTVKIPMENGVESLNAAVSAGVLMYALR
jgi:TrmH family RNA methyltransferase